MLRPLALAALVGAAPAFAQIPELVLPQEAPPAEAEVLPSEPIPDASALSAASAALAPPSFAFQGALDDGGQPVPDGTYTVQVRLFGSATGGTAFYIENHTVTVEEGLLALSIGRGAPQAGSYASITSVDFSQAVWVEVAVDGTTLSPRTAIESVPVARALVAGARAEGDEAVTFTAVNTRTGSSGYGIRGESASTGGRGVHGRVTATTGTTYGVWGEAASTSGLGVIGSATATSGTTYGVWGQSVSSNGRGVYGRATALSGNAFGVWGESASTSGRGVLGSATATSGSAVGVRGQSASTSGIGVVGSAYALSGTTYGVYGLNASTTGRGIAGIANSTSGETYGVYGYVNSPDGVAGYFQKGSGAVQSSAFENDAIVVESEDAVIGLYSTDALTWGSALALGEVTASGTLVNKWGIARQTGATGGLYFTFGTGANYGVNDAQMRIDTDGSVHADDAFYGGGADLAEFFPLAGSETDAASTEAVRPGDLVGLRGGRVSLAASGADQVMVASTDPAFVGNPDAEAGGALVALVGQAEVRVSGAASPGDLLVASGRDDGTARAVAPAAYDPQADGPVAGRVLSVPEAGRAVALVGVDEAAALRAVVAALRADREADRARLDAQQAQIDALARRLDALTASGPPGTP